MKIDTTDVHQPPGCGQPLGSDRTALQAERRPSIAPLPGSRFTGERFMPAALTRWIVGCMAVAAVLSAVLLIVPPALARSIAYFRTRTMLINDSTLSAMPLILAGAAYVLLQPILRPSGGELIKRLMLGSAFLLWGLVQLMPAGHLATELGRVVIALYVLDLALIIRGNLIEIES